METKIIVTAIIAAAIALVVGVGVGILFGVLLRKRVAEKKIGSAEEEAEKIKAKEDRIEDLVRGGMSLNEARQQK